MRTLAWLVGLMGTLGGCGSSRGDPPPTNRSDPAIKSAVLRPPRRDAVRIPAGEFTGLQPFCIPGTLTPVSSNPAQTDSPHRRVDSYTIDRVPTGCAAFDQCVASGHCRWTQDYDRCTNKLAEVELAKAVEYCTWVGGQLPTLDEWQRAARGVHGKVFPFDEGTAIPVYDRDEGFRYFGPEGVEFEMLGRFDAEFTRDLDCAVGRKTPDPSHAKPQEFDSVSVLLYEPRLDVAVPSSRGSHGFRCVYEDKAGTQP